MRSPAGARAGSPKPSPKHRTTSGSEPPPELERNPLSDLDLHVKQVRKQIYPLGLLRTYSSNEDGKSMW